MDLFSLIHFVQVAVNAIASLGYDPGVTLGIVVAKALFGIDDALLIAGGGALINSFSGAASAKKADNERTRRFREYLDEQDRLKREEMTTGLGLLTRQFGGQIQKIRARAARQAMASGGRTSSESYALPAEAEVAGVSSKAIRSFVANTEARYNERRLGTYADYEARPIAPNAFDVIGGVAGAVSEGAMGVYGQKESDKRLQMLLAGYGQGETKVATPWTPANRAVDSIVRSIPMF